MNIGLDLDDVLLATNEALAVFHNRHFGTDYSVADVREWSLIGLWRCSEAEMYRRVDLFFRSADHAATKPIDGAVAAVRALREAGHTLIVITARPQTARECTLELVGKNFPHLDVHFADTESKSLICQRHGVVAFVEDAPHHFNDVAGVVQCPLLFDKPWNQDHQVSPASRVRSWGEALKVLL